VVRRLTEVQNGEEFDKLVEQISRHRTAFAPRLDATGIWALYGLPQGYTQGDILADVFFGDEARWMSGVVEVLAGGSVTDAKAAAALRSLDFTAPTSATLAVLEDWLLNKGGSKDPSKHFSARIGAFPTKPVQPRLGDLIDPLNNLMGRVEAARAQRVALSAAEKTLALPRLRCGLPAGIRGAQGVARSS